MIKPSSTKRRSLRLQKKLRVQHYQEMFISWKIVFSVEDTEDFLRCDDICDILEWFGGFCCTSGKFEASGGCDYPARYGNDIPREIATKLYALDNVVSVQVSSAVDANYDPMWDIDGVYSDELVFTNPDSIKIP